MQFLKRKDSIGACGHLVLNYIVSEKCKTVKCTNVVLGVPIGELSAQKSVETVCTGLWDLRQDD